MSDGPGFWGGDGILPRTRGMPILTGGGLAAYF